MKIAISATGKTLDAVVDPRFGRCQYFIIADTDTDEFEAVDNSSAMAAGGAGISVAQRISQKDVLDALNGLPEESEHCALLASNTLKVAISDCIAMQKEPWKKAYRTH